MKATVICCILPLIVVLSGCGTIPEAAYPPRGKDWFTYHQRYFYSMAASSTQTYQQGNYQITETRTEQRAQANVLYQPVDKPMEKPILVVGMKATNDFLYGGAGAKESKKPKGVFK